MKGIIWKIAVSVICILALIFIYFFGENDIFTQKTSDGSEENGETYIDAFQFDTEELRYDGTGDLDLLEGVSLEGYSTEELEDMVFTRIYAGKSLSEKIIQYTAETESSKIRSTRQLKLFNYTGPEIHMPNSIPTVTRKQADDFGELLATKNEYAIDDGFGHDVRDHADIRYDKDSKRSDLLHYIVEFENMFGDSDVVRLDVALSGEPAYLELSDSEITLQRGDSFNPGQYIVKAVFADGEDALSSVLIRGKVDMAKVGTYEVEYGLEGESLLLYVNVA